MGVLFEGLFLHEIILMILGVVLFLALLFALIYKVLHNQPIKNLLLFFIIPIIMIGFAAIERVQAGDIIIETKELTQELQQTRDDSVAQELQEKVSELTRLRNLTPNTLFDIGIAYATLGDSSTAFSFVDSAISKNPQLRVARSPEEKLIIQ